MKIAHYILCSLLLTGIFLLNACQDDDINGPHGIKITFHAVTGFKSSADTLRIEEALMGIEAIDFRREGEGDSASVEKIVYNGPYVVDLLNGTASPAMKWIFAEPGYYRKIDVTTSNTLTQGKTIILKGFMLPAGAAEEIPFEFITSKNYTLEIENSIGVTVREGEDIDLLVVFDLTDLFREIDLNELEKNDQGIVVISDDDGISTVASLVNAFEAFSSFGINNGLPFPNENDDTPDNEVPEEAENPVEEDDDDSGQDENGDNSDDNSDEEEDTADDESGDSADDEQDDNPSGDDPGNSDDQGDGAADEDEDDGNNDDGYPDSGSGGTPSDDEDDNSNEDEEETPGDEDSENDSGSNEEEPDSGDGNSDEGNSNGDDEEEDNDKGDDDNGEADDNNSNDDGQDDDDRDDDDGQDDDDRDDDDEDDDDDRDNDDGDDDDDRDDDDKGKGAESDKNKDKGKGKGDKGKGKS